MKQLRIALVLGIVLLGILFWLDRHPLRLDSTGPEGDALFPERDRGHGILLVVDRSLYESTPRDVESRCLDLEWNNILRQHFGGCDVVDTATFLSARGELLDERSLLVLPSQTLRNLPLALADHLEARMQSHGLTVVVEAPDTTWCERLGLRIATVEDRPQQTWPVQANPNGFDTGTRFDPPPAPISLPYRSWRLAPSRRPGGQTRLGRAVSGRPEVWERAVGGGAWWVLSIELARLSSHLRQGVPDPDFKVRDRHPEILPGPIETNDLVVAPELLSADHAWLDAWLSVLLDPSATPTPWPRLDAAPAGTDGWLLVSHDDEGFGDLSRWITSDQARRGVPATGFFWSPPRKLTTAGLDSMIHADGMAMGLHPRWPSDTMWKDQQAPRTMWGFWKIQPVGRLATLEEQRQALLPLLPEGTRLDLNRNHFLLWSDDVDQVWRELVGAGMRADSSFGPDWGAAGWLFGSTVPFAPLDRRGLTFPLWEVPYQAAEIIGDMNPARLALWMRRNAEGGRGPIHLLFHPDAYGWVPSADLFRYWDAVPEIARKHRHHPATLTQLLDWWEMRAETPLRWRMEGDELVVACTVPPGQNPPLALTVPFEWKGRRLTGWSASAPDLGFERGEVFGQPVRRFLLPSRPGSYEVRASYPQP